MLPLAVGVFLLMGLASGADPDTGLYNIGVGISDITGPAAGVNLMGYANPEQVNKGIHMRLYSRAFLVDDGATRTVFVSTDLAMMGQLIKMEVLEQLRVLYGDLYTSSNIVLSGTHTHSGPAGYLQYLLFDITSWGFIKESYDTIVQGIVKSIELAHNSVVPGRLHLSAGELLDASINRSPTSYLYNPEEERGQYQHNTDKTMTVLKMVAEDGTPLGMVNWFAVHPTSMNNTNQLISSDNKGYASQLFEKDMNPDKLAGEGPFVAAFAQSNCGDVSPNIDGAKCQDTGEPCDQFSSTCDGRVELCYATGPGVDMEDSTRIIAERQYKKAKELYNDPSAILVTGPVQFIGQQVDMTDYDVTLSNGSVAKTCKAALGFSFAAGTTDGPGAFDFTQGMVTGNPFWSMIVNFIYPTSEEQIQCHAPKPVLLSTGQYNMPYAWHPSILETQVLRIGQLVIAAVPGEFTTMAGRRLRTAISSAMSTAGVPDVVPVIAGLSNVYSHYITTNEEYQAQRYEAASTIYGPHTLEAYLQQYTILATAIAKGDTVPPGPSPPNLSDNQLSFLPGVIYDGTSLGHAFGDVLAQPHPLSYTGETVVAKFVSGHPRNDPQLGGSFLTVEMQQDDGKWKVVAKDADWDTKFHWDRTSTILGTSISTVSWNIPLLAPEGNYRISHSGHFKTLMRGISSYEGVTDTFKVVSQNSVDYDVRRRDENVDEPSIVTEIINWFSNLFRFG